MEQITTHTFQLSFVSFVFLLLVVGCNPFVTVLVSKKARSAKASPCGVQFQVTSRYQSSLFQEYEQVAIFRMKKSQPFSPRLKKSMAVQACKLGADVVIRATEEKRVSPEEDVLVFARKK